MVAFDELLDSLDGGKIGLSLPLGVKIPGRTVNASSVIKMTADEFEVVATTESGWPTLVVGTDEGDPLGVAIDYLGTWRQAPVQEADLLLDRDRTWWAVVAFHRPEYAVDHGNYEIAGHNGYEFIDWPEYQGLGVEGLQEYIDEKRTPILYTADNPAYEAIAIQGSNDLTVLLRMFDLERYGTLMERKDRLYTRVVPKEERWADLETERFDRLQEIYGSIMDESEN